MSAKNRGKRNRIWLKEMLHKLQADGKLYLSYFDPSQVGGWLQNSLATRFHLWATVSVKNPSLTWVAKPRLAGCSVAQVPIILSIMFSSPFIASNNALRQRIQQSSFRI